MSGIQGNTGILNQIQTLLSLLSNDQYKKTVKVFHGGSIGEHIRHILEFYLCLLEGIPQNLIDYGSRARNNILSSDVDAANATVEYIKTSVMQVNEKWVLDIKNEYSVHNHSGQYCTSSVGRELQYAFDHAIHHLALIRIALETELPDVLIDPELGIAPSTLAYREKRVALQEHKP